jgi:Protein of unknown function (DUF3311)
MTRRYRLLALVPAVALLGAPWFANRIEPQILGMPCLLGEIVGWVLLASVVMAVNAALDPRHS